MNHIIKSIIVSGLIFFALSNSYGQYFGKNKPKYETQHFQVLATPHFDMYYYLRGRDKINQISQWTEQWYAMHQEVLQDTFTTRSEERRVGKECSSQRTTERS